MAEIQNIAAHEDVPTMLREMDDDHLVAQNLVQQGAIHAVSFLLAHGCTEAAAAQMLDSLRKSAASVRAESLRRGKPELFSDDQTAFH